MACRQHLSQVLEGLAVLTQQATSASAPQCAASLLHLTQALADQHASLSPQAVPADFVNLLAEAAKQSVGLCVSCVSHQVQAINLRLATSDLFDMQASTASGGVFSLSPYTSSPAPYVYVAVQAQNAKQMVKTLCHNCGYCNS